MIPELLDVVGSALVQSISAPKKNYIATKNWHRILVRKDKEFSSVLQSSQLNASVSTVKNDREGRSFLLKTLSLQNTDFMHFLCKRD